MKAVITFLMQQPFFYSFIQQHLAGRGHQEIKKYLLKKIPKNSKKILDQGCGTGEYSLLFKDKYTGIDNNFKDIEYAKSKYQGQFIVGSATKMKFKNEVFDAVFAIGLHHHLEEKLARAAIIESIRVTKLNCKVIIIDAMWPKNQINIFGVILRKLDRGGNVRSVVQTLKLLPLGTNFKFEILSSFPFDYIAVTIVKK